MQKMLDRLDGLESEQLRWMFHVIDQEPRFKLPAWEPNKLYSEKPEKLGLYPKKDYHPGL